MSISKQDSVSSVGSDESASLLAQTPLQKALIKINGSQRKTYYCKYIPSNWIPGQRFWSIFVTMWPAAFIGYLYGLLSKIRVGTLLAMKALAPIFVNFFVTIFFSPTFFNAVWDFCADCKRQGVKATIKARFEGKSLFYKVMLFPAVILGALLTGGIADLNAGLIDDVYPDNEAMKYYGRMVLFASFVYTFAPSVAQLMSSILDQMESFAKSIVSIIPFASGKFLAYQRNLQTALLKKEITVRIQQLKLDAIQNREIAVMRNPSRQHTLGSAISRRDTSTINQSSGNLTVYAMAKEFPWFLSWFAPLVRAVSTYNIFFAVSAVIREGLGSDGNYLKFLGIWGGRFSALGMCVFYDAVSKLVVSSIMRMISQLFGMALALPGLCRVKGSLSSFLQAFIELLLTVGGGYTVAAFTDQGVQEVSVLNFNETSVDILIGAILANGVTSALVLLALMNSFLTNGLLGKCKLRSNRALAERLFAEDRGNVEQGGESFTANVDFYGKHIANEPMDEYRAVIDNDDIAARKTAGDYLLMKQHTAPRYTGAMCSLITTMLAVTSNIQGWLPFIPTVTELSFSPLTTYAAGGLGALATAQVPTIALMWVMPFALNMAIRAATNYWHGQRMQRGLEVSVSTNALSVLAGFMSGMVSAVFANQLLGVLAARMFASAEMARVFTPVAAGLVGLFAQETSATAVVQNSVYKQVAALKSASKA